MVIVFDRDDQFLIWIAFAEARHDSVDAVVSDRFKEEGIRMPDNGFKFHTPEP